MALTPQQRIDNYHAVTGFPQSMFIGGDGVIMGLWVMGNSYRVRSGYHGGYPDGYLARVAALFPDKTLPFHLCSGKVQENMKALRGITVDINPALRPDYVDNAETLEATPVHVADLVLVDVPYTAEDCIHYGTPMLNRNKVMAALGQRLTSSAAVVWLDQVSPMYRKSEFKVIARIGMEKSTNHRYRQVKVFEKL